MRTSTNGCARWGRRLSGRTSVRRPPAALETPVAGSPVPRAEIPDWQRRFGLVAGITERGAGAPFSLGLSAGDPAEQVMARFRAFRAAMRPAFTALQMAHQVHGNAVIRHQDVAEGWHVRDEVDGHLTAQPGLLLAVTVADCVPVYLTRDDASAIALLHCGWRGAAAGMLEAGITELTSARDALQACPPDRLAVHLGVAICGKCYEVGAEVVRAVDGGQPVADGKQLLDLRAALARRAEAAGVRDISISPLCTRCDGDRFFSHRASGDGGRQIAYLGRPQ
jgi:YfiH family protein